MPVMVDGSVSQRAAISPGVSGLASSNAASTETCAGRSLARVRDRPTPSSRSNSRAERRRRTYRYSVSAALNYRASSQRVQHFERVILHLHLGPHLRDSPLLVDD